MGGFGPPIFFGVFLFRIWPGQAIGGEIARSRPCFRASRTRGKRTALPAIDDHDVAAAIEAAAAASRERPAGALAGRLAHRVDILGMALARASGSCQLAQVMAHCTFPALSRDLLDMVQDRDPGSKPGKCSGWVSANASRYQAERNRNPSRPGALRLTPRARGSRPPAPRPLRPMTDRPRRKRGAQPRGPRGPSSSPSHAGMDLRRPVAGLLLRHRQSRHKRKPE